MVDSDMLLAAGAAVAGVVVLREMDSGQSQNPLSDVTAPLRDATSPGEVVDEIDESLGGTAPDGSSEEATVSDGVNSPGGLPPGVDQFTSLFAADGSSSGGVTNFFDQSISDIQNVVDRNREAENENLMAGVRL